MAETKIKVNTNSLRTDAGEISQCVKQIQGVHTNVSNSIASLDSMWDGPSSEVFKAVAQTDLRALKTILSNLQQIYTFEINAATKYETCERKVSEIVNSIRI